MTAPAPSAAHERPRGLVIERSAFESLLAEARRAGREECCGLLLGRGRQIHAIQPAPNVADDRRRRFEIDPQALVDAFRAERHGGPDVIGYYHSHPEGPAAPSSVDRASAAGDGRVWAIVGKADVTFWCDDERGFAELSYIVRER